MRSKHSQIGSTLTWFVAIIIVIFIMVIFVVGVTGIAKAKGLSGNQKSSSSYFGEELAFNEKLISFLNKPVKGYGTIYDIISKGDGKDDQEKTRADIFKQQAIDFFSINFPADFYDYSFLTFEDSSSSYLYDYSFKQNSDIHSELGGGPSYAYTFSMDIPVIPNKLIKFEFKKKI